MQQRKIIFDLYWEGKSFDEISDELKKQFGESAYMRSAIYKWIQRAKLSQYPEEEDPMEENKENRIDEQLLVIISQTLEEDPNSSVRSIARHLNESHSTVYRYLTIHLGLVYKHTRWLPHKLDNSQLQKRIKQSFELYQIILKAKKNSYRNLITGDQSWFMYKYSQPGRWVLEEDENPTSERDLISSEKVMITIIWGVWGFYIVDMLPEGDHYNSSYFVRHIIKPLGVKKNDIWPGRGQHLIMLHLDNARVHNSTETSYEMKKNKFKRAPHPPYSPDLAPSDFFLFGYVKGKLTGKEFAERNEIYESIIEILHEIPHETLIKVYEEWEHRCLWVHEHEGRYYTEE